MAYQKWEEIYARQAPHKVTDRAKLARMIRAIRNHGPETLPPCWELPGGDCIEGSHRLAAWQRLDYDPIVREATEEIIVRAAEILDIAPDEIADYHDLEPVKEAFDRAAGIEK